MLRQSDHAHKWDLEIKPKHNLLNLHLKDVWNYKDLLWLLVRRDFVSFYKQTIFGPIWFFIQPIFTTIIYTFVFGRLAKISTEGIPPPLFYLTGTIAWNYFAECLTKTSTVFRDNAGIFGKVYFPRLIMPLSIIISNLVKFGVQFLLFLTMLIWYATSAKYDVKPNGYIALFPVLLILMAFQGLGWGLIITALTTKYRDLAYLVGFGVQLLMYATPIIYPLSAVPERYLSAVQLNPLTGLIDAFRYGFLGSGSFNMGTFLYSAAVSIIMFIIGIVIFNRVEKNFVDTI
jgi:lipopolysaccharide transport system permease protein